MAFERVGVEAVIIGLSKFNSGIAAIEGGLRKAAKGAEEAQEKTKQLNKVMTAVGAGMLAAGAATGAFLFSSVRLAARVETLGVVTARLGKNIGLTRDEIRGFEQGIVDQGITLRAARGAIARMIQTQIDLTQSTKLARLAQDAAVIGNINSSEAFERLTFVITSGNVRMARNLGLQVSFQRAYEESAAAIGKTTLELTQNEKVTARTNEVLRAGRLITGSYAEAMETAGKKVLSLDRHLEESRRILGEAWLPVFAEAVDVITAVLKGWQGLSDSLQSSISIFLGVAAVVGVLGGAALLATPSIVALTGALAAAEIALGAFLLTAGLVLVAIAAVVVAGVKWLAFIKDTKEKSESASDAMEDWHREILLGSKNFDEYNEEVRRVNKVIDDQSPLVALLVDKQDELTEAQFESARAAEFERKRFIAAHEAMTDTKTEAELLADEQQELTDKTEAAARAAKVQEDNIRFLEAGMKDLRTTIDTQLTKSVEDFREEISDLEQELADLEIERGEAIIELETEGVENVERAEEAISRLNGQRAKAVIRLDELKDRLALAKLQQEAFNDETSEATRLAKEQQISRTTTDIEQQKVKIAELTGTIAEWNAGTLTGAEEQTAALSALEAEYSEKQASIREQINETKEAFSDSTKRLIFDMFQQRLALDGLTREELATLRKVAGPEGLGILDEASAALLDQLDQIADDLERPGDQSEAAAGQLDNLFGVVTDGTLAIEDLDEAIRNLKPLDLVAVRMAGGQEIFIPANLVGAFVAGGRTSAGSGLMGAIQQAPVTTPEGGTSVAPGGDELNLTINTAAPAEDIEADFQMMRAQSSRNRGGFIQ